MDRLDTSMEPSTGPAKIVSDGSMIAMDHAIGRPPAPARVNRTRMDEPSITPKLVEALEGKGWGLAKASDHLSELPELATAWKQIAISAGSGALMGCLVLLLAAPLLLGRADAAGKAVVIVFGPAADDSPVRFEPASLLAIGDPLRRLAEQQVPKFTLPGQRVAPCDAEMGEEAIYGNCWAGMVSVKPPCGRLFRHGDICYRPVAADPKKPVEPAP